MWWATAGRADSRAKPDCRKPIQGSHFPVLAADRRMCVTARVMVCGSPGFVRFLRFIMDLLRTLLCLQPFHGSGDGGKNSADFPSR